MNLCQKTKKILDEIGIPCNLKGYEYLQGIIREKYNENLNISQLYEQEAFTNNTKPANIERAIRYIHKKYNKQIKEYFAINCKLNNGIFIIKLEEKVMEEVQKNAKHTSKHFNMVTKNVI